MIDDNLGGTKDLRKVVFRKVSREERCRGKKNKWSGVKTFSELARLLTSAYVCLCGHRVQAHPASSAAIKLRFPTPGVR